MHLAISDFHLVSASEYILLVQGLSGLANICFFKKIFFCFSLLQFDLF